MMSSWLISNNDNNLEKAVAIGYENRLNNHQQKLLAQAAKQDFICPLDGQDLREGQSVSGQKIGTGPLIKKVECAPNLVLRWGCRHWLISNKKNNLKKAVEMGSLEELRVLRMEKKDSWKKPQTQAYEETLDHACPFCSRPFAPRDDKTNRAKAEATEDKTHCAPNHKMQQWTCMAGVNAVCVRCFNRLHDNTRRRRDIEKREFDDFANGCSIERARRILVERAIRRQKFKPIGKR